MIQTHNVSTADGRQAKVSECSCGSCKNVWWVTAANEFQPSYCPYCGMKFLWYNDTQDVRRAINGQELE